MKVYGGLIFDIDGKQKRAIITCRNRKEALSIIRKEYSPNYSQYHFNNYWTTTGRDEEIKIGLKNPHEILIATNYHETEFKTYKKEST